MKGQDDPEDLNWKRNVMHFIIIIIIIIIIVVVVISVFMIITISQGLIGRGLCLIRVQTLEIILQWNYLHVAMFPLEFWTFSCQSYLVPPYLPISLGMDTQLAVKVLVEPMLALKFI